MSESDMLEYDTHHIWLCFILTTFWQHTPPLFIHSLSTAVRWDLWRSWTLCWC